MFDILWRIFNYFGITRNSPTPSSPTPSNPTPSNPTPSNPPAPQPPAPSGPITSLGKKPPKISPKKDNVVR